MQSPSITLPRWYRAVAILVGVISIVLAFVVLLDPGLALATLVLLLGFALLVIGIDRIVAGVTGHPYGFMSGALPRTGAETGSGSSGTGPAQNPPSHP
ncbi:MAG: DUF308 domain-containing protein [Thermoplasmata archaeon]